LLDAGNRELLHEFAERLDDYWRSFDRFMVLQAIAGPAAPAD